MKAWRTYAYEDIRLDDVSDPVAGPGQLLVKILTVQSSITEVAQLRGYRTSNYDYIKEKIASQAPLPMFGHEFCGEIVELGEGVTGFKVGDRISYGHQGGKVLGIHTPGAFAEYLALDVEAAVVLDPAIDDWQGAAFQPTTTCVAAIGRLGVKLGDTIAIFGQGVIGLGCMQVARMNGAGRIIGVDQRDEALALSEELGCDEVIDARATDPVEEILELTDGNGPDIVIEAAGGDQRMGLGGTATVHQSIDAVATDGKIMIISFMGEMIEMDLNIPRKKRLQIMFPARPTQRQMRYAVSALASGRLNIKPMLTHKLDGLESLPEAMKITGDKAEYRAMNPAQMRVSNGA